MGGSLPIAQDKRDGEYFECPFCGEVRNGGQDLQTRLEVWEEDENGEFGNDGQWVDGPLPIEYWKPRKLWRRQPKKNYSEGLMPECQISV